MGVGEGYGTQPGVIARFLEGLGDSVMVLSHQDDRAFAALSLDRFQAVGSTRLDWRGQEVLEQRDAFDGEELRRTVLGYAEPGELAVVFWDNLAVPSVALDASGVAAFAEAVVDVCRVCWIYLTSSGVLIQFRDGEGMTVARVPG